MKMPNTKYTGSFIKGGPGENQSYKKYYGKMLTGFKEGGTIRKTTKGPGAKGAPTKANFVRSAKTAKKPKKKKA